MSADVDAAREALMQYATGLPGEADDLRRDLAAFEAAIRAEGLETTVDDAGLLDAAREDPVAVAWAGLIMAINRTTQTERTMAVLRHRPEVEAAIRAEYEGNLQRLTEANLAYGAEIDRLRADHQVGTLDVDRLIQAVDTVAHPAGVPPLSDEWWRVVAAEYARLAGADR